LTRMTLITIKTQEAVQNTLLGKKTEAIHTYSTAKYNSRIGHTRQMLSKSQTKENNAQTIQAYTGGIKNVHGVGSGVAIFVDKELVAQRKFILDLRCSNNQAEQLAIAKALEYNQ